MSADHKDEYARSSDKTGALRVAKEALYAEGFPADKTRALAAQYFQAEKYSHLRGQSDLTYLVAPSTSGENTLPVAFAQLLQQTYGGRVVTNWATPNATQRTATMDGITKLRNQPTYQINRDVTESLARGSTLVLVDDVVTTGGSIAGMREALAREGLRIEQITSLAQSDMRKVRDADIDRIVTKLGNPSLRPDVALALDGRLKHFANYIETSIRKTDAERNNEIATYFRTEAHRLRELSRTDAGAVLGIAERIKRLESVQSRESSSPEVQPGLSRESRDLRASIDRQENGPNMSTDLSREIQGAKTAQDQAEQLAAARNDGYDANNARFGPWKKNVAALSPDEVYKRDYVSRNSQIISSEFGTLEHARSMEKERQTQAELSLTADTKSVLSRLDALRIEYEQTPNKEKIDDAREAVDDLDGPDVTKIPLSVAAQDYVQGHISRVDLEIMAAENERGRDARVQAGTNHQSHDEGHSLADDR